MNLDNYGTDRVLHINLYSIFFDRDGVVNIDKKYVHKIKDFKFRKNVIQTFKFLNKKKINIKYLKVRIVFKNNKYIWV